MKKLAVRYATTFATLAATLAGSAALASVAENGPFTNGSFELNPLSSGAVSGRIAVVSPGDTSIVDWDVFEAQPGGDVEVIKGNVWDPQDGNYSLDLNGATAAGGVKSVLTGLNIGTSYLVSFWGAGNPLNFDDSIKTMSASIGPENAVPTSGTALLSAPTVYNYSYDTTGRDRTNMGWQQEQFSFTASDSRMLLGFYGTNGGGAGATLDNVTVTEVVPLPMAGFLLLSGLGGLAMFRRKSS